MEPKLIELSELIEKKRPELYSELVPGTEMDNFISPYDSIPEMLKRIWCWRNGQDPDYSGNFHSKTNEMLISYNAAREVREELNEYVESGDISPENWNPDWLPFTENGGGNYMCASLSTGEVFYFDKYEVSTGLKFKSVSDWLEDLISGYKEL